MTFELLNKIISDNNIPHDVVLQSDSGWECCETETDGVLYNRSTNTIIFTQQGDYFDYRYFENDDWELLNHSKGENEND